VLRLDLNAETYTAMEGLQAIINLHLDQWEQSFPPDVNAGSPSGRFSVIIRRACIIIDEYDKPLLSTIGNPELHEQYKQFLKPFFGVLKSVDAHLEFAFITGVTKFGQVSIFSDLNQLIDLSLDKEYAALCGLTEPELLETFAPEIAALAESEGLRYEACIDEIRRWYNGYRFHPEGSAVYNPLSTLNLFRRGEFQDYWFQTGTPTFLVELLKKSDADLRDIEGVQLPATGFADYRSDPDLPLPVIYQSGYLTIKSYDKRSRLYTLGYPNLEVERGFLSFALPFYSPVPGDTGSFHIASFTRELESGDVDAFLIRMKIFFEAIPYDLNDQTERHYHVVFYLIFKLLGQYIESEVISARGRCDAVVRIPGTLYLFEFKLNGTAEEALKQIDDKGYLLPFTADKNVRLVKVGVEFDRETRNIARWLTGQA
jgi:hypothetical protein